MEKLQRDSGQPFSVSISIGTAKGSLGFIDYWRPRSYLSWDFPKPHLRKVYSWSACCESGLPPLPLPSAYRVTLVAKTRPLAGQQQCNRFVELLLRSSFNSSPSFGSYDGSVFVSVMRGGTVAKLGITYTAGQWPRENWSCILSF